MRCIKEFSYNTTCKTTYQQLQEQQQPQPTDGVGEGCVAPLFGIKTLKLCLKEGTPNPPFTDEEEDEEEEEEDEEEDEELWALTTEDDDVEEEG